jgi:hypothetical protein
MLDLRATKKLSFAQLRERWEEYRALPQHHKDALQTYVVAAVLMVAVLVGSYVYGVALLHLMPVPSPLQ